MKSFTFFCILLFPFLVAGQMNGDRPVALPSPISVEVTFAYDTLYLEMPDLEVSDLLQLPIQVGEVPAFEVHAPRRRELYIAVAGYPETVVKAKLVEGYNRLELALWHLGKGIWEVRVEGK